MPEQSKDGPTLPDPAGLSPDAEQTGPYIPPSDPNRTPTHPHPGPVSSPSQRATVVHESGADGAVPPGPVPQAGRYPVLREIARGGMGAVLEAQDPVLGRRLALKVLLEEHQDHPELVRRFLEEAQINGQLQHPGIVPVYELGRLPDRRPFFAMKMVHGQTLAAQLGARRDPAEHRTRFLTIFEQVCQTMAYAHARGVIHRDLKPSNIMVGPFGEVQVMDWGLAKVLHAGTPPEPPSATLPAAPRVIHTVRTDSTEAESQAGAVLGTPAYMAPEQARGDVENLDERCDVFGLGAILCVILTGKPPYEGPTKQEVHRQAESGDLSDALARLDACGADPELLHLARSCLAPDPRDRPRDAGVVALQMTNYRASVQQRLQAAELDRASAQARAAGERKARRLTAALAAAGLLLVLAAGGGWRWVERQRAERADRFARTAQDVDRHLQEAARLRDRARDSADDAPALWAAALAAAREAQGRLAGGEADPSQRGRVEGLLAELEGGQKDQKMAARLERIRSDVKTELKEDHFDFQHVGPAYARAFRDYGIDVEALPADEAAGRIRERPIRAQLVAALDDWADLARGPGRARLLDVVRRADPDPWRLRLRDALAKRGRERLKELAGAPDVAKQPANTLYLLGKALGEVKETDEAVRLLCRAQQLHPTDYWLNFQLAFELGALKPPRPDDALRFSTVAVALRNRDPGAHLNLGYVLQQMGRLDDAADAYRHALDLKPDYAMAHYNLANLLIRKGLRKEAVASFRKAVHFRPGYFQAYNNMGNVLADLNDLPGAVAAYRKALELKPDHANAHHNLGLALDREGKPDEAIECFRQALHYQPNNAVFLNSLGVTLQHQKRLGEALDAFEQAVRNKPDFTLGYLNLAAAYEEKGEPGQALAAYRRAARCPAGDPARHYRLGHLLLARKSPADAAEAFRQVLRVRPKDARCYDSLGTALAEMGLLDDATAAYREAIRLRPDFAMAHYNLGVTLRDRGLLGPAVAAFRRAVDLDGDDPRARHMLATCLTQQGKVDEAIPHYQAAIRLKRNFPEAYNNLGNALRQKGRTEEAIAAYKEAVRLKPDHDRAYCNLGRLLEDKGDVAGALDAYRAAVRVKKNSALGHCLLGELLCKQGRFAEALPALRRGHELGSPDPRWTYPSKRALAECERLIELDRRLPAVLKGEDKPANARERVEFASLCLRHKRRYAEAARLYREAFADRPELAQDVELGHRYDAACAAARAGCGAGEGGRGLSDKERAGWRKQARDWLRAELESWAIRLEEGPPSAPRVVAKTLRRWQRDPDLACVRDPAMIAHRPADEQAACRAVWGEVNRLLKRAQE